MKIYFHGFLMFISNYGYYNYKNKIMDLEEKISEISEVVEKLETIEGNKNNSIFLVFGEVIQEKYNNVKLLETYIIPNINEKIVYDKKIFLVTNKTINYTQVANYSIDDSDRGGELIYIFLKEL